MMRTKVQAARKAEAKQRPVPKDRTRSDGSADLLHLQQAAGNRAVSLLLGEPLQRQPEEEEAPMPTETTSTTAAGPTQEEAPMPPEATPAPPVKGTAGGEQAPMPPETTSTTAAGPKGEEAPMPPEAAPAPPVKGAAGGEQAPMPPETTSTSAAGPKGEEAPMPPEATPAPPVKGAGGEQAPMPTETTSTAAAGPKEVTSPTGGLSADARTMALGMYESMVIAKVESAHSAAAAKDAKSAYADVGTARDAALAIGKQIGPRTEATATLAATYAILQNSHTRLEPHVGVTRTPLKDIAKEMDPKSKPMASWLDGPRIALTKEGE